jgi:hypothetical protein
MGIDFSLVALDLGGRYAPFLQLAIQKDPGAGPGLPVDEPDPLSCKILEPVNLQRILSGDEKAEVTVEEIHHDRLQVWKISRKKRDVVDAA